VRFTTGTMVRPVGVEDPGGMSVVHSEFREHGLASRIVQGVLEHDAVRAHGAVVATLQLYPIGHAIADVFLPALRTLEQRAGADARQAGARTIHVHVRQLLDGEEI
jgi:hypothetical protein